VDRTTTTQAMVWIQEDASWLGRTMSCLSPGHRATTYRTLQGPGNESAPAAKDSESMLTHSKGCTNGVMQCIGCTDEQLVFVPCCCYLPYLDTKDASGRKVGRTQYLCDANLCVPKFEVRLQRLLCLDQSRTSLVNDEVADSTY
jgi:hypothetical protein